MKSGWEYTSVQVDAWMPLSVQAGPKEQLGELGAKGWEAFAVTPPTPATDDEPDPDGSVYEILLKRPK